MTRSAPTFTDENTWTQAKAMYLGGATATVVAKQFGVTPTTIYNRASREGWGRKTRPAKAALAACATALSPLTVEPTAAGLAEAALIRAAEALEQGRPGEVQGYLRAAILATRLGQRSSQDAEEDEPVEHTPEEIAGYRVIIQKQLETLRKKIAAREAEGSILDRP